MHFDEYKPIVRETHTSCQSFIENNPMAKDLVKALEKATVYHFRKNCRDDYIITGKGRYFWWSLDCGLICEMSNGTKGDAFDGVLGHIFEYDSDYAVKETFG